jgi:glycogen debranching enzyme
MKETALRQSIYQSVLELATDEGINASGKEEIYGCIFGRDSFITINKLLKVYSNVKESGGLDPDLHRDDKGEHRDDKGEGIDIDPEPLRKMCKTGLTTLMELQGKETNLESGEEPGKFIHEYRKEKHERLTKREVRPWYLYPDNIMRNYDSIDSTPLGLITINRYWKATGDNEFLLKALPHVEEGLNWIVTYGDRDKDQLVEYELPKERTHGGLVVQSWTDSKESMIQADGTFPLYPIAPVEVQGYTWLALKMWADYYGDIGHNYARTENFAHKLNTQADNMKKRFNETFLFESEGQHFPAQALDGDKNQLKTVTGNPLLLLWSGYARHNAAPGSKYECILEDEYIPGMVKRSFMPDMFEHDAGIRTMSTKSTTYIPGQNSYHNGSFWPKLNGMAHEGLVNFGYRDEAEKLHEATLAPIHHFGTPIELYVKHENQYMPYQNERGQQACKQQAWSAAVALDLLTL